METKNPLRGPLSEKRDAHPICIHIAIYGWFMCSQITPVISERYSKLNSDTNHRL